MSAQNEALEKANPHKFLIDVTSDQVEVLNGLRKEIQKNLIPDQRIPLCLVNEGSTISFSILCCVENEKLLGLDEQLSREIFDAFNPFRGSCFCLSCSPSLATYDVLIKSLS